MTIPNEPNEPVPLIDVRPESAFVAGHVPGSVGIPLEELPARSHELPPASSGVCVTDSDESRARQAAELLRRRGHDITLCAWDTAMATESGASTARLWQPNPFLVEAVERIAAEGAPRGAALDVACGSGRDAVYLALRGYQVEAIDLLPDALSRAQDLARRSGVSLRTRVRDLERDPVLPRGSYELVAVFRYLQRSLFPAIREAVRTGGYVVYETFHERNRQTGQKPQSPEHLLQTGELRRAFEGFDVLICREALGRDGRFFSALLARRTT